MSRPLESSSFELTRDASLVVHQHQHGEAQTTPRTTAAINYMNALQLSTPRMGIRSNRKGTPLKRQQPVHSLFSSHHSNTVYETTPKKLKSHENIENETNYISRSGSMKVPFRTRLDRSLSQTMSPLPGHGGVDKLDCTFDAISSSTPICQPFRAEFYEQHVEEIPLKNLTRSGGKNTRTKIIRKMQSFSPRKLMGLRAAKVPLREMDQNSVDFHGYSHGLFPVEEEESPIPKTNGTVKKVLFSDEVKTSDGSSGGAFSSGLRDLMFGAIKNDARKEETPLDKLEISVIKEETEEESTIACKQSKPSSKKESVPETSSSQLLDIYVTNLSNLDGGDSNSHHPLTTSTEDGDVSMNNSMVADVERYFDELKRNTTQVQEHSSDKFVPLTAKNSLDLYDMLASDDNATEIQDKGSEEDKPMEVEVTEVVVPRVVVEPPRQPMLLRKRKRPSTELIQAVLATPKKMRRSQSFHMGDGHTSSTTTDENVDNHFLTDVSSGDDTSYSCHLISPTQRLGGARKRLNYEPVPRNRHSPAKRNLAFDGSSRRRSLTGTPRLNIFRHLGNCPPVRDYFFEFVEDKDLVAIYAVSRQCRAMIEEHPRLNARRMQYLEAAWRKKENNDYSTSSNSPDEPVLRIQGEQSIIRIPLHNRNVDTSALSVSDTMSPPVSPSRRKFHENQKVRKTFDCCFPKILLRLTL